MNALQKEVDRWAEDAPSIATIANDYAAALTNAKEQPSPKNVARLELIGVMLIAKVMYDNGYVPVFEDEQLTGYTPKDLNELN